MKTKYINLILVFFVFGFFLLNRKQNIIHLQENDFCSTKTNNITMYHGPNTLNNKSIIILKKGYPLFVLKKQKEWIKVIDYKNRIGWIQKINLSNVRRTFVIRHLTIDDKEEEKIIFMPFSDVTIISEDEQNFIAEINTAPNKTKKVKIPKTHVWLGPEKNT